MASSSEIEWTDATWNPATGCTKISQGCKNCYAETFAERWRGVPGHPYESGFDLKLWEDRLDLPHTWKTPRMIFVNSMSDLFHEDIPSTFVRKVFDSMVDANWHTYQLLTKRADRLLTWANKYTRERKWPAHVWIGTSVESIEHVDRIERLAAVEAPVRFISFEPLLGPVLVRKSLLRKIQWAIVGGESGTSARPMNPEWARSLRDQCLSAGVKFFFKQWGTFDEHGERRGKKKSGRKLDGRLWNELPVHAASA